MNLKASYRTQTSKGFSFVELLAVIAVLLLMSSLILPVLARAHQSPQAAQCLTNHRQLMMAALMYSDDNAGLWFPNQPGQYGDWINTFVDFYDPQNTNLAALKDPTHDLFAKYIPSPLIFHCPSDQSFVPIYGKRVRSVAASQAVGTMATAAGCFNAGDPVTGQWLTGANTDCDTTYRRYGKTSDMVAPSPSRLWVFIDEHCNSINDSGFAVECAQTNLGAAKWIDLPASYHDGAVTISFADGHVELHKWAGAALPHTPVSWNGFGFPGYPTITTQADLGDLNWLQQRTSAKAN